MMWLRDLLPSYLGGARIATFSYLSDWYTYGRGVKTSIRELGEQLLNALHQDRHHIGVSFASCVHAVYVRGNMSLNKLGNTSTHYLHRTQHGWSGRQTGLHPNRARGSRYANFKIRPLSWQVTDPTGTISNGRRSVSSFSERLMEGPTLRVMGYISLSLRGMTLP